MASSQPSIPKTPTSTTAGLSTTTSTPVRVPKSTSTYTTSTLGTDLRSEINTLLLRDGHVEKIHSTLHHALHADAANWPSKIRAHALELLRQGDITTFPKLMERVLEDVKRDTERVREAKVAKEEEMDSKGGVNGSTVKNGSSVALVTDPNSLAVPLTVIDEGVRVTRECLELVCEMEE